MSPTRLRVRFALAVNAAEDRLRLRFPSLLSALAPRRPERAEPFAELQRIEVDPAYRTLFLAELDTAISDRMAQRAAMVAEVEWAADVLRSWVHDDGQAA
ncbi:hypothetical protein [Streptomyces sp. CB02115]|uniref:hypothetical protein n=1 Tax=Streptomyces sp. CB02115 TaxID=1703939 RepID=UPI001F515D3C|nr:hypothetical protein [Streptomyces sp. CB02115]